MDNRQVIPHAMQTMIVCSIHYGHPGRDPMLAMVSDIWLLNIHREVIDQSRLCDQCLEAGTNSKCILKRNQVGSLPEVKKVKKKWHYALQDLSKTRNKLHSTSWCQLTIFQVGQTQNVNIVRQRKNNRTF